MKTPNRLMPLLILTIAFVLAETTVAATSGGAPPRSREKPTLAVLDFSFAKTNRVEGREKIKTDVLTDRIKTALVASRKFDVVERQDLDAVLAEAKFSRSSVANRERVIQAGRLAHADFIILGTISVLETRTSTRTVPYVDQVKAETVGTIVSDARVIDVARGVNVFAGRVESTLQFTSAPAASPERVEPGELFFEDLLRKHSEAIASKVVECVFPLRVADQDGEYVYLNRGEGSGLKNGDRLKVFRQDGEMKDPDTGESLGFRETPVATVEVFEILPKVTKARILETRGAVARGMTARIFRGGRDE